MPEIAIKFISPMTIASNRNKRFTVDYVIGDSLGDIIDRFIVNYGKDTFSFFYEKDGQPYVVFLLNGKAISLDYILVGTESELWVLPPIGGG